MNIIDELWYGNINPCEEIKVKGNYEYDFALKRMSETLDNLMNAIPDEQKALFDEFIKNSDTVSSILERAAFRKGFCLAVKMMTEVPDE